MKKLLSIPFVLISLIGYGQAIPVTIAETEYGFTLMREGEPYYIRGAGGHDNLDHLLELGGNSIRTWSAEDADEILDAAHEKGLTVMFGLWVQHERHGFDYNDEVAVAAQLERFRSIVYKYKDHPAVLLWGIGNEVDLFYSNTKVWDAIQDIAAMIHEVDPNHPTATVTAGLDSMEVHHVKTRVPDMDIYGVNTYGDLPEVPGNIRKFGWEGPFIISEWGPNGHWEVSKTEWGAPIEQNSTEKAESYGSRYQNYIHAYKGECIGSYVFLWGQKQETTSTWYGLFTAEGEPTEPLDRLYAAWRGEEPEFPSPSIVSMTLNGQTADSNIRLVAESPYEAQLAFADNGNRVNVDWYVFPESNAQSAGGDFEAAMIPIMGTLSRKRDNSVRVRAPEEEGAYRLFVFIRSNNGDKVAYSNIPFYVVPRPDDAPQPRAVQLKERTLQVDYE